MKRDYYAPKDHPELILAANEDGSITSFWLPEEGEPGDELWHEYQSSGQSATRIESWSAVPRYGAQTNGN